MPRRCERPGCSMPAEVAYGFDAESQVVWLDRFEQAQGQRAGALCRRHADAMVVPLGWMLDDRREPTPRLFNRARMDDLTDGMARPASRRQRQDKTIELLRSAVLQLTLDELGRDELRTAGAVREIDMADGEPTIADDAPGDPQIEQMSEHTTEHTSEPESSPAPPFGLAGLDRDLAADIDRSGPMAIVLALVGDETGAHERPNMAGDELGQHGLEPELPDDELPDDESAQNQAAQNQAGRDGDADEAQVLPWQPRFDPEDDLKGLLKPRGRLLSRAFQGIAADGA